MLGYGDTLLPLADLTNLQNATPGATTDFFAAALTNPWKYSYRFTVTVALDGAAKFGAKIGAATLSYFNGGTALAANCLYTFSCGLRPAETLNFQIDTVGVAVKTLYVEAVGGGM